MPQIAGSATEGALAAGVGSVRREHRTEAVLHEGGELVGGQRPSVASPVEPGAVDREVAGVVPLETDRP